MRPAAAPHKTQPTARLEQCTAALSHNGYGLLLLLLLLLLLRTQLGAATVYYSEGDRLGVDLSGNSRMYALSGAPCTVPSRGLRSNIVGCRLYM